MSRSARTGGHSDHVGSISDTSPGSASTAAGDQIAGLENYDWFTIDASLVGATGGTLDVYLQRMVNGTWVDWVHFPQLADGAAAVRYVIDSSASPSVAGATVVGSGTTPALAANKMACVHPGSHVRALYVAGSGTSAGAVVTIDITGWQSAG